MSSSYVTREQSTGDMKGRWQSGTAQRIDSGKDARDGEVYVFLSSDWESMELSPPTFNTGSGKIPVRAQILDDATLLQCTAVAVLNGTQCGPWHLNLVAHVKDWLFSITPVSLSNRDVEGVGEVDYINLLWCSDSQLGLYENTSRVHGIHKHPSSAGKEWDAHWCGSPIPRSREPAFFTRCRCARYIYRRGNDTPSYAHVGSGRPCLRLSSPQLTFRLPAT